MFAPFVNEKGVTLSVTRNKLKLCDFYKEDDWKAFELYKHRQDCLEKRSINFKNEIYESFSKSRDDTLKGHCFKKKIKDSNEEEAVSIIEADLAENFDEEYFEFYHQFRADSLKSRQLYLSSHPSSSKLVDVIPREPKSKLKRRWKASLNILKKGTEEKFKSIDEHTLIVDSLEEDKSKKSNAPENNKKEDSEQRIIPPKISFERSRADILEFIQKLGKEKSKRKKTKFKISEGRKAVLEELFADRTDFLRCRTVTFSSANDLFKGKKLSTDSIEEIIEEFECPFLVSDPETFIQKRIFNSSRKECLLIHHYGKNRLLQSSHLFDIPRDNKVSSLTTDMVKSFDPNHKSTPPSLEELRNLLSKQLEVKFRIDKEILLAVEEMKFITQRRKDEEEQILLTSGFFQFNHNPLLAQLMEQEKEKESKRDEEEKKRREEKEGKVDTISPYFPLLSVDNLINAKELIKERCLEDLMKRLEIRANLLQDRLDKARAEIMFLREELGGRKRRPSPEERLILSEKLSKVEAEHRRLRGFLVNWRNEAAHRYELLEAALETNPLLNEKAEEPE